jgi:hypothetical protein
MASSACPFHLGRRIDLLEGKPPVYLFHAKNMLEALTEGRVLPQNEASGVTRGVGVLE